MFAAKTFSMSIFATMPIPEVVPWLFDAATLQQAHHFHGPNWSDWVPGAARFRQHAVELTEGMEAAKNKDREKVRELEEKHAETLLSIHLNANYIAMRSIYEKDESLLHNVGYILKDQNSKKEKLAALKSQMHLKVKNRGTGTVTIYFERDPAAGLYRLQVCKGEPSGEESWLDGGLHKGCRVVVSDLDRASWYYFRGRSHGDNQTGPWSQPVGIIVT